MKPSVRGDIFQWVFEKDSEPARSSKSIQVCLQVHQQELEGVPISGLLQALYGWENVIILFCAAKNAGHALKAEAS